jgi:uncharacterized protein with PIN domain
MSSTPLHSNALDRTPIVLRLSRALEPYRALIIAAMLAAQQPAIGLNMKEKVITCIQCERPFVFTVSEQEYFMSRGFDKPKRCPECRKKKWKLVGLQEPGRHNSKKKHHVRKYEV